MYGINTQSIPLNKLWFITPSFLKPHLLKQLKILTQAETCPFLNGECTSKPSTKSCRNSKTKQKSCYNAQYTQKIEQLKQEGRYRVFTPVRRVAQSYPQAFSHKISESRPVTIWCSNDYLGMAQHPEVISTLGTVASDTGVGAGGTRNIAGNSIYHLALEKELAELHQKESGLVCSSGFVANQSVLQAIKTVFPDVVYLSDEQNHASIIEGIKSARAEKMIFKHNDLKDLEEKLQSLPLKRPKVIVFESVYSMSGSIADIRSICALAKQYNAQTLIDEVHAVGLYGQKGAGVAERDGCLDQLDFITGTLGKAYGVFGGYIVGKKEAIDCIRSLAPTFIFTTSLPPSIAAAAQKSIQIVQNNYSQRQQLFEIAQLLKESMKAANIPVKHNPSHIIPIFIGNAEKAKRASDLLLKAGLYLQPINFPTVKKGEEILRVSPTPNHTPEMIEELVHEVKRVFKLLEIPSLLDRVQWGEPGFGE